MVSDLPNICSGDRYQVFKLKRRLKNPEWLRVDEDKRGFWRKEFLSGLWLSFPEGTPATNKESGLKVSYHISWARGVPSNP